MFRYFISFCLLGLAVATAPAAPSAQTSARPPNIVFILADDLGYTDIANYGSKYYETPNVDKLAADGLKFTSGYTCGPNCQPTRAALMSGQYGPRTGVYTVGGINRFNWQSRPLRPVDNVAELPLSKITIAQSLKKAGYVTGMFGKWHLGNDAESHPSKRGFDEAIVTAGKHYDFKTSPPVEYPEGTYLADFITSKATDFIRRHKDEPFFLYVPHYGVHAPHEAKAKLIERFKTKPTVGGHDDPTYAAMIASIDESVGNIVRTLEELQLSDNTLVIFSSDNGGVGSYQRAGVDRASSITDNAPLRGGKGMLYEGGIRVPYIFRWSKTIAPGQISETPINSVDLYPTLLEIAQATRPDPSEHPLDGESYLPLLKPPQSAQLKRDSIFWHFPGYLGAGPNTWRTTPVSVIRSGDWKLLEFLETGELELYNLKEDLSESNNLSNSQSEKVKELHAKLTAWRTSIKAPLPAKNDVATTEAPAKLNKKEKRRQNKASESTAEPD